MVRLRGGYGEGIFNLDTEKSTFKRLDDPKVTPRKNEPKGIKNYNEVTTRGKSTPSKDNFCTSLRARAR